MPARAKPAASKPETNVDSIPVGQPDPPQVAVPQEPLVATIIMAAGRRMMLSVPGDMIEVFDGDGWSEMEERKPDGMKLRNYQATGSFPEAYVRADENYILLWPTPSQDTLFRITRQR
jgi:hypothetical protein